MGCVWHKKKQYSARLTYQFYLQIGESQFFVNSKSRVSWAHIVPAISFSKERWDHIWNYRRLGRFSSRVWVKHLLVNLVFYVKGKTLWRGCLRSILHQSTSLSQTKWALCIFPYILHFWSMFYLSFMLWVVLFSGSV